MTTADASDPVRGNATRNWKYCTASGMNFCKRRRDDIKSLRAPRKAVAPARHES